METLIVDSSSLQAQSFLNFAKTLTFVKSVQTPNTQFSKDIFQAAKECNATTVDVFFDEVDNRNRKHFNHV